jgi:ribonuclease/clavin/mitogillin
MATKLVPLPETQRLSSRVIRILGGNPGKFTLQGTNTYLVGNGAQRILIDTGEGKASWIKAIEEVLKKERAHCYAVVTHRHMDHIGGISDLHKLDSRTTVYKYDPDEKQKPIVDGQVFQVEGATLRAIHTPGFVHTPPTSPIQLTPTSLQPYLGPRDAGPRGRGCHVHW